MRCGLRKTAPLFLYDKRGDVTTFNNERIELIENQQLCQKRARIYNEKDKNKNNHFKNRFNQEKFLALFTQESIFIRNK